MSVFQLTPDQIESMTDEQIAEAYQQFKSTQALLSKRVAKAKRAGTISTGAAGDTLAALVSANRQRALAANAHSKTQARLDATSSTLATVTSAYLTSQKRDSLTPEEQAQLDETANASVAKAEAAYEKVRNTMRGKNSQAIHAERVAAA
jgi:hypothetical protein